MFSLPINPFLDKEQTLEIYIPFLEKYKNFIDSLYFTCRIKPFSNDSMGAIFDGEKEHKKLINQGFFIQEKTGIPITPVFNSPNIWPGLTNLELFIKNFTPLYELGIRSMTMIQIHWAGFLKKQFPLCEIKSSVVRPAIDAQSFVDYALAGFDVVQIDRNLMRDQNRLKEIATARKFLREKYNIKADISLLANEHCRGRCPFQSEHYVYNAGRRESDTPYIFSELCSISCGKWKEKDRAYRLKICDMPPWKKDWDQMLKYVQSFKLHGRDDIATLNNSMRIIKNYAQNKRVIDKEKYQLIQAYKLSYQNIELWLKKTKTCKSQCWKCGFCDELAIN